MKCPNCTQHKLAELPDNLFECTDCGFFEKADDGTFTPTDRRPAPTPDDPPDTGEDPPADPEPPKPTADPQDEPFLGIRLEPFDRIGGHETCPIESRGEKVRSSLRKRANESREDQ